MALTCWRNNACTRTSIFLTILGVSAVGLLECKTPRVFNQFWSVSNSSTTVCSQGFVKVCGQLNEDQTHLHLAYHIVTMSLLCWRMSSLHVCQWFSLLTISVSGGVGSGEGAGDEKVGLVGNPGQWGDLPQPPRGAADSMCILQPTHTHTHSKIPNCL